jgi:hypothetical protein
MDTTIHNTTKEIAVMNGSLLYMDTTIDNIFGFIISNPRTILVITPKLK